jgi:predicted aldo/keto reductase-like oxidoreductase
MSKNKLSRRSFFASTALGTAGLLVPGYAKAKRVATESEGDNTIVYRTLGRTGIKVPVISCGKVSLNNQGIVNAAVNKGILHFDTARRYDNGENEAFLGKALKKFDREKLIVATKIRAKKEKGLITHDVTTESLLEQLELCLEQLQMDYVDILYIHGLSKKEAVTYEPMVKALTKAKELGKAKALGVSTHSNMAEVISAAIDTGIYDVVLTTYNYQLKPDQGMEEALKKAGEAGIGIVAMKTQAGKFLDKEKTQPVNDKAAIKWILKNPNVSTIILSIKTYDKLEEFFSIMTDMKLSDEEMKFLQAKGNQASLFCVGCEKCLSQCKNELPIPELMRAYMYNYGYGEAKKGYELIQSLQLSDNVCVGCGKCTVKCNQGFDIAQKITDITRLKDVPGEFLV